MSIQIAQGYEYQGEDWWKWWLWIEGAEEDLDQIDHVIYTLHSSFPNPVRKRTDRESKFRLSAAGWGVFRVYARVIYKDGEQCKLVHDLELAYPDGTMTTA